MSQFQQIVELIDQGRRFALATVVHATGSCPQKAGAKAAFTADGAVVGTLGGGCLEAESRRRALDALDAGAPLLFQLNLDDDYGWDDGLICGGRVRVFVDPWPERCREAFARAAAAEAGGERGLLRTALAPDLNAGPRTEWIAAEAASDPRRRAWRTDFDLIQQCIERERPVLAERDGTEMYYEPVGPRPTLLIAGGGHVGQATARMGAWLGFDVVVVDDRAAFARPELYPEGVKTICGDIPGEIAAFPINSGTYIVIVTRGHRHDGVVLRECIHSPAAYIGMIGSRRKAHIIRKGFLAEGIASEDDFRRVYTPIGLDIGAQSVEEIAVSIVSQIVAVRRKRAGATSSLAVFATP